MFTLSNGLFDRRALVRVILQKVNHAAVSIDDEVVGKIGLGYFLLVGFAPDDTEEKLDYLVHKITNLRVFEDAITFKIALMVVKYMKYMETMEY